MHILSWTCWDGSLQRFVRNPQSESVSWSLYIVFPHSQLFNRKIIHGICLHFLLPVRQVDELPDGSTRLPELGSKNKSKNICRFLGDLILQCACRCAERKVGYTDRVLQTMQVRINCLRNTQLQQVSRHYSNPSWSFQKRVLAMPAKN